MSFTRFFSRSVVVFFAIGLLMSSGCSSSKPATTTATTQVSDGYAKALKMYDKRDYQGAIVGLESLLFTSRATALEDSVLFLLAQSYYHADEYLQAADMYTKLLRQKPFSPYARTAQFMVAKSYEQLSPYFELDQQYTRKSIEQFSLYQELYPAVDSSKVVSDEESRKMLLNINQDNGSSKQSNTTATTQFSHLDSLRYAGKSIKTMREKLAKNAFFIAKQYVQLGKYKAAGIFYDEVIAHYPDTIYDQPALVGKINVLVKRNKWFDARLALDQYLLLFPDQKKAMQELKDKIAKNCKN